MALLPLLAVAGCSRPPGTTLQEFVVGSDEFVATDSRLRLATNSNVGTFSRPGLVDPTRIICTEPSPDVAVAVANSLAAGVTVLQKGSGSLSFAQVEGLVALGERTAAIQLLRDKMYQTCLAYSNGAISGTTYSLAMADLDDTIVTMLLGETAGGAFGRQTAAIATSANANAEAALIGFQGATQDFNKQTAAIADRQLAVDAAKAELAAAEKKPEAERPAAVEAAKLKLAKAEADLAAAYSLLQSKAETMADAAAKVESVTGTGGLTRNPDAAVAGVLAEMQSDFLLDDFNENFVSACLAELAVNQVDAMPESVQLRRLIAEVDRIQEEIHGLYDAAAKEDRLAQKQLLAGMITQALAAKRTAEDAVAAYMTAHSETLGATTQVKLVGELYERWTGAGPEGAELALVNYVAGVNMGRRSALTDVCLRELPDALKYGRLNLREFRESQLRYGAAEAEAQLLKERQSYLNYCKTLPGEQRTKCENLLLGTK